MNGSVNLDCLLDDRVEYNDFDRLFEVKLVVVGDNIGKYLLELFTIIGRHLHVGFLLEFWKSITVLGVIDVLW